MRYNEFYDYLRCEAAMSPHTVAAYIADVESMRRFLKEELYKGDDPEGITTDDLRLWIAGMSRLGQSPRSVGRRMCGVRALFRFLSRRKALAVDPMRGLKPPKPPKSLPSFVPQNETQSIIDVFAENDADSAARGDGSYDFIRNNLIVTMLYSTGMRAAELVDLLDVNVDTVAGELKVRGKRNKERVIPFGNELKTMIEHYRTLRSRTVSSTDGHFFLRSDGRPLYYRLVYRAVHGALDAAAVHSAKRSPHVLRHSFATDMLNNGSELTAVQQLLGHSSLQTTQKYTHLTYRELQQNYELAHPRAHKTEE